MAEHSQPGEAFAVDFVNQRGRGLNRTAGGSDRQITGLLMPFGDNVRLGQEMQELSDTLIGFRALASYNPQAAPPIIAFCGAPFTSAS